MKAEIKLLRSFCAIILYAHQRGADGYEIAKIIEELFNVFMNDYKLLPMELRSKITPQSKDREAAEIICEYIACMTDMCAVEEHRRLFDVHTRF